MAASLSSGGVARNAFRFASYAAVKDGLAAAAPAPPPRAPGLISHTPVKSGNLASAAQSAAVGALAVNFWAWAIALNAAETNTTAAMAERMVVLVRMTVKIARFAWNLTPNVSRNVRGVVNACRLSGVPKLVPSREDLSQPGNGRIERASRADKAFQWAAIAGQCATHRQTRVEVFTC